MKQDQEMNKPDAMVSLQSVFNSKDEPLTKSELADPDLDLNMTTTDLVDGDADASDLVGNEEVTIRLSGSNKVVLQVLSDPPIVKSDQLVVIETHGQIANSLDDEQIDKIELAGQNNRHAKSSVPTTAKKIRERYREIREILIHFIP